MLPLSKKAAIRKVLGDRPVIIDVSPNYSRIPTAADLLTDVYVSY